MKHMLVCWLLMMAWVAPGRSADNPEQILDALRANPQAETVLQRLPEIYDLVSRDEAAGQTVPVVEQAVAILLPVAADNGQYALVAALLKTAARLQFEQSESDKAVKHLQALRELYQRAGQRLPPTDVARRQPEWDDEVAFEYLRGDLVPNALAVLGERVDRGAPSLATASAVQAAVAGALFRRLEALSTDRRFELLHNWTMPAADRRTVRVFSSLAAVESPPDGFARALGERPRANAFPIPTVGGVDGLFCTGWLLAHAAAESGRARRLTSDLEELAKAKVPQADFLLLLVRIADQQSDPTPVRATIENGLKALGPAATPERSLDELQWLMLGAACLARPELQAVGQHVFESLLERHQDRPQDPRRAVLRRARALAILRQHASADPGALSDPGLKFWIPASEGTAASAAVGAVRDVWLVHEQHIVHLAGPQNDYLCFRYPLTGEFEFQVEAQSGGREGAFGNLSFGGLAYGVDGNADEFRVRGLEVGPAISRPFPFVRREQWPTYQRLTLRSTEKGIEHLINGHPVWLDPLRTSSGPWLALRTLSDSIPAFRNLRVTGHPIIPREVRMSDGNQLRGWFGRFYPGGPVPTVPREDRAVALGPQANPAPPSESADAESSDWFVRDGVIHGARRVEPLRMASPSCLRYFRPLQNGESIAYEFFYEPGKHEVHPSLGRIVFLIEPNGVRIRWLTSGPTDWTGLAEQNATVEPLNRRGPRPLPLQSGEWNRLTAALDQDVLSLSLNGVEIYSRKMTGENWPRFGLYHDRKRSAVQVRHAILKGDWPDALTDDDVRDLLARRADVRN